MRMTLRSGASWWYASKAGLVLAAFLLLVSACTSTDTGAPTTVGGAVTTTTPDGATTPDDRRETLIIAAPTTPPGLDWEFFAGKDTYDHPGFDILNVRYFIFEPDHKTIPVGKNFIEVFRNKESVIIENLNAKTRSFLVSEWQGSLHKNFL